MLNTITAPVTHALPDGFRMIESDVGKLQLINEADFELKEYLRIVGLPSECIDWSTSDEKEINARQAVVSDLMNNPLLFKFFLQQKSEIKSTYLPTSYTSFVKVYQKNKRTAFWRDVDALHKAINESSCTSRRMIELKQYVESNLPLEITERNISKRIKKSVDEMVIINGTISFNLNIGKTSDSLHPNDKKHTLQGFRRYSKHWIPALAELPDYMTKKNHTFWKRSIVSLQKTYFHVRRSIYMIIARKAESVEKDVLDTLMEHVVNEVVEQKIKVALENLSSEEVAEHSGTYTVQVRVIHDAKGTRYILEKLEKHISDRHRYDTSFDTTSNDDKIFLLWPRKILGSIYKAEYESNRERSKILASAASLKLISILTLRDERILGNTYVIKTWSPSGTIATSKNNGPREWPTMESLWNQPTTKDAFGAVKVFVGNMESIVDDCRLIAQALYAIQEKAKGSGSEIELPTHVPGGHIIAFKKATPMHVQSSTNTAKPICNLEPMGGDIVVLTGDHGGGKTVACIALAHLIWLAQTGLPVFGTGVQWNVKKTIGLSLLDRTQGKSTMQSMASKIKNMIDQISSVEKTDIVLIMDEVGTGTQEGNGIILANRIISSLETCGVNLFCTTQITDLAQSIKDKGGTAYVIDNQHNITPGVGGADIDHLMDKSGLTTSLDKLSSS